LKPETEDKLLYMTFIAASALAILIIIVTFGLEGARYATPVFLLVAAVNLWRRRGSKG
jgi:hypothetical protein